MSGRAQIKLALQHISGFGNARLLEQLSDGPSNKSYLLELGGQRYVLRLDKPAAASLGLDRENERQVYIALAEAGLAPEPEFFDPAKGILLRRYLPGRSWTQADLLREQNLRVLAAVLSHLHALPPAGKAFEPFAAASRYAAELGTGQAERILEKADRLNSTIEQQLMDAALCHNDLLCQNMLQADDGRLSLIDWEYAAVGDRWFDLAIVVQHHDMDRESTDFLTQAYLGRPATAAEQSHLANQCQFYQCLLDLWTLRTR